MHIIDDSFSIDESNKQLFTVFYSFAKAKMKFSEDISSLCFVSDKDNAQEPLGKTAYYEPSEQKVFVYVDGRHIKDMLRSFAHELVHHQQNCNQRLQNIETGEGYAQKNRHLRQLEEEAYLYGNMSLRDWEDNQKQSQKVLNEFINHLKNIGGVSKKIIIEGGRDVNKKKQFVR